VIDARDSALLKDVLRRESRSFLQYFADSFPWTTSNENDALGKLQKLTEEEREATASLGRFLYRQRQTLPYLGAYPSHFTTLNYVALDYLLPKLAEEERAEIAGLERDLNELIDPEAREEIDKLLSIKRRHLQTIESLAAHATTPSG
jgi:hypothetical protein